MGKKNWIKKTTIGLSAFIGVFAVIPTNVTNAYTPEWDCNQNGEFDKEDLAIMLDYMIDGVDKREWKEELPPAMSDIKLTIETEQVK